MLYIRQTVIATPKWGIAMFKKTVIAASVIAAMAAGTSAFAEESSLEEESSPKYGYDFYGIVAVQIANRDYANQDNNSGFQVNNETRLGFRGYARFDGLPEHTKFIWQVESGYVDESFGGEDGGNGYLGRRDTFIGLDSEKFGLVRAGRVLTPIYELIDWPAANPGLGDIWDWGGNIGGNNYNDRQSDTVRWDTLELWSGFTLDLAVGAGQDRAGASDSVKAKDNYWHGAAAHQKFNYGKANWIQFDLAYEMNYNTANGVVASTEPNAGDPLELWDNQTYLVGIQGDHGPWGYFAQYRVAKAKDKLTSQEEQEISCSTGLMYNFGPSRKWQVKAAYAKNYDLEVNDTDIDNTGDDVWSTQLMYKIDTNAVVYARYRDVNAGDKYNYNGKDRGKTDSFKEASVGIEYYF